MSKIGTGSRSSTQSLFRGKPAAIGDKPAGSRCRGWVWSVLAGDPRDLQLTSLGKCMISVCLAYFPVDWTWIPQHIGVWNCFEGRQLWSLSGITENLTEQITKMGEEDKLLVWYSGHAKGHKNHGTLILPAEDKEAYIRTTGLWLEEWLLAKMNEKPQATLWCVIAACRDIVSEVPSVMNKEGRALFVPKSSMPTQTEFKALKVPNCMFMYCCELEATMYDTSLFARLFCYQLRCQPTSIQMFQQNLVHEVEVLSFGHLKMEMIPVSSQAVGLFKTPIIEKLTREIMDPQYIDNMTRFRLCACHCQILTDSELSGDVMRTYEDVRRDVCKILRCFKNNKDGLSSLEKQIPILTSNNLKEVLAALDPSASGSRNSQGSVNETEDSEDYQKIPKEVIDVIGRAVANTSEKNSNEFPAEQFVNLLQNLACHFAPDNFEAESESDQGSQIDGANSLLLCSSGVQNLSDSDTESLVGAIEKDCQAVGIDFQKDIKMYLGHSSFWLLLLSSVKLDTQRLQHVVAKFVEERCLKSFAWAFAAVPREQPWFAAPGLWKVVSLLRTLEVPQVMCLRARELKRIALQLLKQRGKEMQEWQVRVVSNHRDLKDDAWIDAQRNDDFHFVTQDNWQTFDWKRSELRGKLEEFAEKCGMADSHTLHASAYLAYELHRNPQGLPLETLTKILCNCKEPKEMLTVLVEALMDPTPGYSENFQGQLIPSESQSTAMESISGSTAYSDSDSEDAGSLRKPGVVSGAGSFLDVFGRISP